MTEPNFDKHTTEEIREALEASESKGAQLRATAEDLRAIADDAAEEAGRAENIAHHRDEYTGRLEEELARRESSETFAGLPTALAEMLAVWQVSRGRTIERAEVDGVTMIAAPYFAIRAPSEFDASRLPAARPTIGEWFGTAHEMDGEPTPCTVRDKPAVVFHGTCYDPALLALAPYDGRVYGQTDAGPARSSKALIMWSGGRPLMLLMPFTSGPDSEVSDD